jgi:tight adherence protein B
MPLYLQLILYAGMFMGIVLIVDAVFGLTQKPGSAGDPNVKRRLDALRRVSISNGDDDVLIRKFKSDTPEWMRLIPFWRSLTSMIQQSGTGAVVSRVLILMVILSIGAFVGIKTFVPILPLWLVIPTAILLGIEPLVLFFKSAVGKRRRMFEAQLPDALDLVVRSLKVGHPLSSAMAVVAREIPDPLGTEFQIAFDQVTYGDEVPQAFLKMNERIAVPDLAYLTTAIQIQYESGGNLAEVLTKLSTVIRDRFRMFRKVNAITAEGRFSAWFLSIFPVGMIFAIQLVKPDYYTQVYDFPYFPHLAAFTFILLIVNLIAMKVLTSIKV